MTDDYIPVTNTNVASNGAEAETIINDKDEEMTTIVHETGYESECSSSSRSEIDVTRSALAVEADAFTRFVERQRVEVMFELRNLRLGERPVTGQPNRDRIQTFINNIQQERQQPQQPQQSLARTFSTRPAVPSAHVADIDALANRRCVSAALGSGTFRQALENAVRRSIETQGIPQAPPVPRTLAPASAQQQTLPVVHEQPRPPVPPPRRQAPLNIERQERELQSWQTITELQRETIVIEISDLVHRQLVSSALESDFRSHLERSILNRLAQGAPQENQQQQQRATVPVPTRQVLPTPAPAQPTTQTRSSTLAIDDISTRLDTMQHMLQLMFSMQMDMQRSLRQEVASAMATDNSNTRTSSSQPINSGHCTVCLTAVADTVLYRCGHLCVCYVCGLSLREAAPAHNVKCPICRAPVDDILRVYRSSRDGE